LFAIFLHAVHNPIAHSDHQSRHNICEEAAKRYQLYEWLYLAISDVLEGTPAHGHTVCLAAVGPNFGDFHLIGSME
jgi:hypothetical protein